jgi:hypothetical protein
MHNVASCCYRSPSSRRTSCIRSSSGSPVSALLATVKDPKRVTLMPRA